MSSGILHHPKSILGWTPSFVVLGLLLFVIVAGTGESIHSQLLKVGSFIWDDYFILRGDIPTPSCNPNADIETRLDELEAQSSSDDEMDLFEESFDREATRSSLEKQSALCHTKHEIAQTNQEKVTASVIAFRSMETTIAKTTLFALDTQRLLLLLLIFITGSLATWHKHHIAFRPVKSLLDNRISTSAQLLGSIVLVISTFAYRKSVKDAGVEISHPEIIDLMLLGFAVMGSISLYQLFTIPKEARLEKNSIGQALLSIPIYTYMSLIAGIFFFINEGHYAGIAILFSQVFELAGLYLNIGLYIWVGMLLKQTRLGQLVFDVFKPWRLPPELLTFTAILVMAVPTAYTGASGIVIIAMGLVVYEELRRVGTRRQLALATTAMTGSAGVVLRPCLLVVAIAMLNNEVVTDELYGWGTKVFILTVAVFLFFAFITKKEPLEVAPFNEAFRPTLSKLKHLIPYFLVLVSVLVFYEALLNTELNEFSAPIILPVIIIGIVIYERIFKKEEIKKDEDKENTVAKAFGGSINGASVHIGAILVIMGASFTVGGLIERSGIFEHLPETFGSIYIAMAFLVALLVFIGMIMDPFGALVLVSATIATIAYKNGIDPIHFWMVTLVAFELGYLSPPVSLNHLLTRQVVGEEEAALAAQEGDTFWYRHEKLLLPIVVMGCTLIIVAFGPLLIGYSN